jgi:hypothetical protein
MAGPGKPGVREAGFDKILWMVELEDDFSLAHIAKVCRVSIPTVKHYLREIKRPAEACFYLDGVAIN